QGNGVGSLSRGAVGDGANDVGKGYFHWVPSELVAAASTTYARHEAGRLELQENLHEEPLWDAVGVGDRFDPHGNHFAEVPRQFEHGDTGVFSLGGDAHSGLPSPPMAMGGIRWAFRFRCPAGARSRAIRIPS